MKVTVIYGSPRKGTSYKAAQIFKDEMFKNGAVEFMEFFLPKDMPEFCLGCAACIMRGEDKCPHAQYTVPVLNSMLNADALIFTTPVYALQTSGTMKNFLDHFSYIFIVHRARPEMFSKKAFVISTTVGAGTKSAIKTVSTSLKYWGVNRIYSAGYAFQELSWEKAKAERTAKFERNIKKSASKFFKEVKGNKRRRPYLITRFMFRFMRMFVKKYDDDSVDKQYWQQMNWFKKTPFENFERLDNK